MISTVKISLHNFSTKTVSNGVLLQAAAKGISATVEHWIKRSLTPALTAPQSSLHEKAKVLQI